MKLENGKSYFLKINYKGRILEYEGKIIYLGSKEFGIQTEEDCDLRFRIKDLTFSKEISEIKTENKIVVRKKGPLQESEKPSGLLSLTKELNSKINKEV